MPLQSARQKRQPGLAALSLCPSLALLPQHGLWDSPRFSHATEGKTNATTGKPSPCRTGQQPGLGGWWTPAGELEIPPIRSYGHASETGCTVRGLYVCRSRRIPPSHHQAASHWRLLAAFWPLAERDKSQWRCAPVADRPTASGGVPPGAACGGGTFSRRGGTGGGTDAGFRPPPETNGTGRNAHGGRRGGRARGKAGGLPQRGGFGAKEVPFFFS